MPALRVARSRRGIGGAGRAGGGGAAAGTGCGINLGASGVSVHAGRSLPSHSPSSSPNHSPSTSSPGVTEGGGDGKRGGAEGSDDPMLAPRGASMRSSGHQRLKVRSIVTFCIGEYAKALTFEKF